jgi:hypothetical protein
LVVGSGAWISLQTTAPVLETVMSINASADQRSGSCSRSRIVALSKRLDYTCVRRLEKYQIAAATRTTSRMIHQ